MLNIHKQDLYIVALSFLSDCYEDLMFHLSCPFSVVQVVALQMKLHALSEENQQQAEELTLWKLASQPVPTFDQNLPNTDDKPELQDQAPAVRQTQSDQQQAEDISHVLPETQTVPQALAQTLGFEESTPLSVLQSPDYVKIIREDELFLSCSSSKLHGRMLASR